MFKPYGMQTVSIKIVIEEVRDLAINDKINWATKIAISANFNESLLVL